MELKKIYKAADAAITASAQSLTKYGAHSSLDDAIYMSGEKITYDEVATEAFVKGARWMEKQLSANQNEE